MNVKLSGIKRIKIVNSDDVFDIMQSIFHRCIYLYSKIYHAILKELTKETTPYTISRRRGIRNMNERQLFERITTNPKVMVGKPVIKGTRLTVEYILNLMAQGETVEEILNEYEGLTEEDIRACLFP